MATKTEEPSPTKVNGDTPFAIQSALHASLRVPGDTVNKATSDLPDNQRSAIRRLHQYYVENDLSLEEAARLIRLTSGSTLSQIFSGKYPAKLDSVVSEIEHFFEVHDSRSRGRKVEFIHTTLSDRIWSICTLAVEFQKIAMIIGDTQIGKTEALLAYQQEHNHGNTIYTDVPTGGALSHFIAKLAERLRISRNQKKADLRRRIIDAFDDRMLLIVDEIHRATPAHRSSVSTVETIEFIRELYDERKCGVVLCGTRVFSDAVEKDTYGKILRQTKRRRLCTLQLPARPSREDLNTFAAAYHLKPSEGDARKLENEIIDNEALGMWLTLLRMAAKIAAQKKQKLDWPHVITAHQGLQTLEGKN